MDSRIISRLIKKMILILIIELTVMMILYNELGNSYSRNQPTIFTRIMKTTMDMIRRSSCSKQATNSIWSINIVKTKLTIPNISLVTNNNYLLKIKLTRMIINTNIRIMVNPKIRMMVNINRKLKEC